jgi:hypothetical protein
MTTKTKIALAALLVTGTASVAGAREADPIPIRGLRTAPAQLQENYREFQEPPTQGAGHMPRAFYDQQQFGYPQSPSSGGGN